MDNPEKVTMFRLEHVKDPKWDKGLVPVTKNIHKSLLDAFNEVVYILKENERRRVESWNNKQSWYNKTEINMDTLVITEFVCYHKFDEDLRQILDLEGKLRSTRRDADYARHSIEREKENIKQAQIKAADLEFNLQILKGRYNDAKEG